MIKLSLVMIVRNEEKVLARCLNSVLTVVDEIIVIDTGSTDSTKEIASGFGAKIFEYEWQEDFAAARNYGLEQTTGQWVIVLDADEYILNDCGDTIRTFISERQSIGRIRITNKFVGENGLAFSNVYIKRLFPAHCRYVGSIHEQIASDLPSEIIDVNVFHDGYYNTNKSRRNIDILTKELSNHPQDAYYLFQIAKEFNALKEHNRVFDYLSKAYQLMQGNEPFAPNIVVDYMYSVNATRNFEIGLKVINEWQETLANFADFHFVCGLFYLDLMISNPERYIHYLPKVEECYLRCLTIGENSTYANVVGTGSFSAMNNLAAYYEVTGQKEKAAAFFENAKNTKAKFESSLT
ncbi:glycosyltransferase family 2 protein [Paenibacillus sp. NPDC057967]|uniref:glycosyltransferase family 2 protein n=1 Tax=Paenibacillus sp. NPDC057967 TaxID=3346293 RepID=UPI0036D8A8EC